jgi:uncharacterized SAM-binding protein YcdF (DUF218 family)
MYRLVVDLLEPHTLLFLLTGWVVFRLWRKRKDPKRSLRPLVFCLLALTLLCMPPLGYLAVLSLECHYPPADERPTNAEAIVVFSAGLFAPEGPRLRAELDENALQRCLHVARLYAQGPPCPVLVSGGKVDPDKPGPPCATVMADFLRQIGVKPSDLLSEEKSRTTHENEVECAKLLKERRLQRVVLVVDAVDMLRAAACLRKHGIEVLPSPCHFRAPTFRLSHLSFIPSPGAAAAVQRVWHEWLGIVWYRVRGRL